MRDNDSAQRPLHQRAEDLPNPQESQDQVISEAWYELPVQRSGVDCIDAVLEGMKHVRVVKNLGYLKQMEFIDEAVRDNEINSIVSAMIFDEALPGFLHRWSDSDKAISDHEVSCNSLSDSGRLSCIQVSFEAWIIHP